jgi:hypothetical protein
VQTLATLGIPGLALTVWALAHTAVRSYPYLRPAKGPARMLPLALWAALIGLIVTLTFETTLPGVTVWLWLAVGLLLAPISQPIAQPKRAVLVAAAVIGVALALWAGSWLVADVAVGRAMQMQPGPAQVAELENAARLDPITPNYGWRVADAIVNEALAQQRAGQTAQAVDATMLGALTAYDAAAKADHGNALLRARPTPTCSSATPRVTPRPMRPLRPSGSRWRPWRSRPATLAALGALARAHDVSGRHADAQSAARLARQVTPDYAAQTLGSLGLDTTTTP